MKLPTPRGLVPTASERVGDGLYPRSSGWKLASYKFNYCAKIRKVNFLYSLRSGRAIFLRAIFRDAKFNQTKGRSSVFFSLFFHRPPFAKISKLFPRAALRRQRTLLINLIFPSCGALGDHFDKFDNGSSGKFTPDKKREACYVCLIAPPELNLN